MNDGPCIQERYAPENTCFGCGPANGKGLRLRSFATGGEGDELICEWRPEAHHEAFPGMLNGGIAGALLDCHSNWAAAHHLMRARGLDARPCTVTPDFHVTLRRPTPTAGAVTVKARVVSAEGDKVVVDATLEAGGKVTCTCRGTFVAVREGHPAFHRW
jgi:acyl-coenzyme A thioesterase PaaI-like protein